MKRKIISFLIFGAAASVLFPVSVYADTPTADNVEDKRVEVELRKKEYLEALEKENAARDILVNAERALDDAQEKYDYAMDQYKTGVKGFFDWIIETETDLARISDAENALEVLDYFLGINGDSELSPYFDFGGKKSATNITRVYYMSNWLDEFEKYNSATSIYTSHTDLLVAVNAVIGSERGYGLKDISYLKYPYWTSGEFPLNTYALYNDTDVPELNFEGNEIAPEFLSAVMINEEGIEYTPKRASLSIACGTDAGNENLLHCSIKDLDNQRDEQSMTHLGEITESRNTYTLSEYAQTIRDYYALVDPLEAIALFNSKNDDFSNAQKEYDFSWHYTKECLSRLRGAEKEYEEATALLRGNQAQQVDVEASVEKLGDKSEQKKKDGVLAQVLSYILNGGAIALVIPTGLLRKREIVV